MIQNSNDDLARGLRSAQKAGGQTLPEHILNASVQLGKTIEQRVF
jgi:hypothetical protein